MHASQTTDRKISSWCIAILAINLSLEVSYGSFNSFFMSSNFQLILKLNSVQCLFLMQWNIAAQGNILKKGQRVGQLRRQTNDVWLMMDGKRACRRISFTSSIPQALSCIFYKHGIFFTQIFLYKILVTRNETLFRNPFYNAYTNPFLIHHQVF